MHNSCRHPCDPEYGEDPINPHEDIEFEQRRIDEMNTNEDKHSVAVGDYIGLHKDIAKSLCGLLDVALSYIPDNVSIDVHGEITDKQGLRNAFAEQLIPDQKNKTE